MASSFQPLAECNDQGSNANYARDGARAEAARTATSDAVLTTQLVEALACTLLKRRDFENDDDGGAGAHEAYVQGAVRLCIRILTSHIGEPLMMGDEGSICQVIRTRLVKVPSAGGIGVETALRFEDLQRRLRLIGCIKNRASVLHLLHALADSGTAGRQCDLMGVRGLAQVPPGVFAEPVAGLSGIDRVGKAQPAARVPLARAVEGSTARGVGEQVGALGMRGAQSVGRGGDRTRGMSEVTERTLLRGILYAFQGIDSQHIKYCGEESGYVLDPGLRLGRAELALVQSMLEMGWLFTEVVRYIQDVETGTIGGGSSMCSGRIQQAFVFSLKEDLTEYYRLIAVLGAQLNLDTERAGEGAETGESLVSGGTEGLTLRRLAVWIMDPLERLKLMATLVAAAGHSKGGPLMSCLHMHIQHGDAFVRGLVQRTMVRVCEPLFFMIRNWVFEGELVDHHREFFVQMNPLAPDEMLWQQRYSLEKDALPPFIGKDVASNILVIGKAINFLRRLCGDSEWIMGSMAKAAAQAQTLEYGNTASLQAVVDSCSTLTNARLVHLMLGPYRLKSHLRMLKKFLLHGQGDLMLTLVEVLGAELNKKASMIFLHNLKGIVEGVVKTSNVAQDEPEDVGRVGVRILTGSPSDTGWQVFSLTYAVESPVTAVVHTQAMLDYRRVFHLLWRIKRVEWSLASAWRLHTSATHVRVERALPELRGALHRCSLVRGQMVFLTTNLSNYMMFEVLETSWGALEERLDSAKTLDNIINAHNAYLSNIHSRALLHPESNDVMEKLTEVLSMIIEFCGHQESLIIRAMAEVTTQRAERDELERRTARGQWGLEGEQEDRLGTGGRGRGRDPFGMGMIEDTARRYEEALSDLVCMLEEKSAKTEILRYLTFRLDFNDYYKGRRAALMPPPPPRRAHA